MHSLLRLIAPILLYLAATIQAAALSDEVTDEVVRRLDSGFRVCVMLDDVYKYDCYRQVYGGAADVLKRRPDYAQAEQALRKVEKTLRDIMRRDAPAYGGKSIRVGKQTFRAVEASKVESAKAAFRKAEAEATTVLLRAQGQGKAHFQRIAQIVGSDKVLFRS